MVDEIVGGLFRGLKYVIIEIVFDLIAHVLFWFVLYNTGLLIIKTVTIGRYKGEFYWFSGHEDASSTYVIDMIVGAIIWAAVIWWVFA